MYIVNALTGRKLKVTIDAVESNGLKKITRKKYFFDWSLEKNNEVYKLTLENESDILGLMSLERIPEELRVHIRLLITSKENVGKKKSFENIAANLITHACKIALKDYAEFACVSLKPKAQIMQHYIDKYDMNITGTTLSLELKEIMNLIKQYDNHE